MGEGKPQDNGSQRCPVYSQGMKDREEEMEEGIKEDIQEGGESKASQMAGVLGWHR